MQDPVSELALQDGRFSPEAFRFLFEALEQAVALAGRGTEKGARRHVSGGELLEGLRVHGLATFGPLTAQVWRQWGVHTTLDWGHIVFLLVDGKLLRRQDSDTLEDFRGGYDFEEAFVRSYRPVLPGQVDSPRGG